MSQEKIIDKWIGASFDAKIAVTLVKNNQYFNAGISFINGKEYKTKLGPAMSVQLRYVDIEDLIQTLQLVKQKMNPTTPGE